MAAVVAAEGVVKTYGQGRAARRVLDGASLHVHAGEVVAILGRSGTGKSTFLHLIGGLDRPQARSIRGPRSAVTRGRLDRRRRLDGHGRRRARAVAPAENPYRLRLPVLPPPARALGRGQRAA